MLSRMAEKAAVAAICSSNSRFDCASLPTAMERDRSATIKALISLSSNAFLI
jgi:hypothetical protein